MKNSSEKLENSFIPYALPFIEEEDIQAVGEALRSNWLTTGPRTKAFEREFSSFIGTNHAIALNSCTAGLHLLLKAAGVGPGDEVVLPDMTFCATANTVIQVGARPVFADIDEVSLDLTKKTIESCLSERTKVVMPVHYAGNPCQMDEIRDLAKKKGLVLIEDAAHAVGTYYRGKHVGAENASFSFYATKNLTTGEGGLVSCLPEWEDRIRTLALHGLSRDAYNRYEKGGKWFYEVAEPGFKYNMTDMQAALGLVQLGKLERMQKKREGIAERYNLAFGEIEGLILPPVSGGEGDRHAWHLYLLRVNEEVFPTGRDGFIQGLTEAGIGISVHFIPLHRHPAYDFLGYRNADFPVCEKTFSRIFSLPLYPGMKEEDIERVIEAVKKLARR
ncbi:MAG TPA: UDP-4-amino-4,6-dideoxy-N-acetyl-beta-L-altrosamine transaminase [Cyanobacteria bacterium UBA8530]|nr:UDP-4-amino-4,6-dideoxy-N-acetyl-beta-L-altrosamine transaminase [Cyanobacteria bacterium UBA8530]